MQINRPSVTLRSNLPFVFDLVFLCNLTKGILSFDRFLAAICVRLPSISDYLANRHLHMATNKPSQCMHDSIVTRKYIYVPGCVVQDPLLWRPISSSDSSGFHNGIQIHSWGFFFPFKSRF